MAVGGVADVRSLAVNEEGLKVVATNGYKKNTTQSYRATDEVFLTDRVAPFASKPAPTLDLHCLQILCPPKIKCGSGGATIRLAREKAIAGAEDFQAKKNAPNQSGRFSWMRPLFRTI
jgi:hypothetical protein